MIFLVSPTRNKYINPLLRYYIICICVYIRNTSTNPEICLQLESKIFCNCSTLIFRWFFFLSFWLGSPYTVCICRLLFLQCISLSHSLTHFLLILLLLLCCLFGPVHKIIHQTLWSYGFIVTHAHRTHE